MAAVGIMVSLLLLLLLWFLCIGIRWIAGSGIESESNYKNINIQFYRFINERTWCIWCAIVTRFSCSKSNRIESPNGRKWNKTISNKNNTKWNIIRCPVCVFCTAEHFEHTTYRWLFLRRRVLVSVWERKMLNGNQYRHQHQHQHTQPSMWAHTCVLFIWKNLSVSI